MALGEEYKSQEQEDEEAPFGPGVLLQQKTVV